MISEFRHKLRQASAVGLTDQETELVLSGQHPAVALYTHKVTHEPQLRLVQGVAKGAILGQFATRVVPSALSKVVRDPMDDDTLAAYRRNCFAVVEEFETDVWPDEFTEEMLGNNEGSNGRVIGINGRDGDNESGGGTGFWGFRDTNCVACRCDVCNHGVQGGGKFVDPALLADHLEQVCIDVQPIVSDVKKFACPWHNCGMLLSSKQNMRLHVKGVHGSLMFQCPMCSYQYRLPDVKQAREHMRNCNGAPPANSPVIAIQPVATVVTGSSGVVSSPPPVMVAAANGSQRSASGGQFDNLKGTRMVKLRFEGGEACNIFGLGRCDELQNLSRNCHLITTIINGLPYVCVETLAELPAGTELVFDWGDVNLTYIMRFSLFAMASHSHSCHIYRRKLESLYNIYNLPRPKLGRIKSVAEDTDILWQRFLRSNSLSLRDYKKSFYQLRAMDSTYRDEALPFVSRESAFEHSECTLLPRTKASPEVRRLLMSMSAVHRPPRWQEEFADKIRATEALLWSTEAPNVEIRRIDYLFHPVRFLNPPGRNQYGVFARVSVPAHAPILCYKGEIITQQEHDAMSPLPQYAFDFTIDLSLHINADDNGNEGRFVNDCFGRMWERGKADSDAANASYHICWDDTNAIPVLFVVAKDKYISPGDEIVVDYGSHFWNPLMHELGKRHAKFYCRTRQINEQLVADLRSKNISVPEENHWPDLLTSGDTFIYRPLPPGATPDWEMEQEECANQEMDVERIVDKRVMPFGVQYLVKWESFDWSHNTWTHARDAPADMVAAFEAKLAGLDDGTPQTRRKAKSQGSQPLNGISGGKKR